MFTLAVTLPLSATPVETAREFRNPVLRGYHADPTICRVGDDYYLATSSSEYFPGVPIYHSRDLVNWRLIGHALHRPEQVDFTGVENSKGVFAPTLRHHDGVFYLVTTLVGAPARSGNFIVTATNPAGPWSDPLWLDEAPGIDPSLFFDEDGRVYYCGNRRPEKMLDGSHRLVWVQEIDLRTGRFMGPRTEFDPAPLYASQAIGPVGWLEAPHIYRRGEWYYLLVSHGGTWLDHAVSFWRSRRPLGPWEMNPANPVLTHRGERPPGITSTGHADLVQAPSGEWWAVLLAIRGETGKSVMGRETFLCPVDWSSDWPVFNAARRPGRVELTLPLPRLASSPSTRSLAPDQSAPREASDTGAAAGWVTVRAPKSTWWRVTEGARQVRLTARPDALTAATGEPSALLRRVTEESARLSARVEFAPEVEGARAGLAVLRARDAVWTLAIERQGAQRVASAYRGEILLGRRVLPAEGAVELRVELHARRLVFLAGPSGGVSPQVAADDAEALATSTAGRFTGSMAGVFAQAAQPIDAVFAELIMTGEEER
jgi:alpha-N-arabinofuranosidase